MKKQQIIIALSVLLLLVIVFFMGRDLFTKPGNPDNPTEYNIDKYRIVDSSRICYRELKRIPIAFDNPAGLALDSKQNIYVAGDQSILIFDAQYRRKGSFALDTLVSCLAITNRQSILAGKGSVVEEFDRNGKSLRKWTPYNENSYLTSIVQIGEFIYVADAGNRVVLQYNVKGELQNEIGRKDSLKGIGGFILPSPYFDVALGPGEDLWVANTGMHLLQNFAEDGKLITSWGETSMQLEGFAGCCNPAHFAILPDGCFVTYEKGMDRVKLYNRAGIFVCVVTAPTNIDESALTNCNIGARVHDLAVDAEGNILVLDAKDKMICVYSKI
ncbi:MAG: hypothetical protein U0T82_01380 [Bacteroidales bacterium]